MPEPAALSRLLNPRVIAAVGASSARERLSGRLIENLERFGYTGNVVPVNPRRGSVAGLETVESVGQIKSAVDLAFISLPIAAVEQALDEAAMANVPFAVVLTSGFEGDDGLEARESLQSCIRRIRKRGLRVLGPNCIGLVNVSQSIVARPAMFLRGLPPKGGLTLISQSGGLSLSVLNEAAAWSIGVRHVLHTGNEADLGLEDLLEDAAADAECDSIAICIEQIRRPKQLAEAAKRASAAGKRLTYLKIGRSTRGQAVTRLHTGAVAGDASVYDAFLNDLDFYRADSPRELLLGADRLWPVEADIGRGCGLVSISGGEAGLAADMAEEAGVRLARPVPLGRLSKELGTSLESNPVDVTGEVYGSPGLIASAVRDLKESPDCGSIIVSFPPIGREHFRQFTSDLVVVNAEVGGSVAIVCPFASEDVFGSSRELRSQGVAVFESLQEALWVRGLHSVDHGMDPFDSGGAHEADEPVMHLSSAIDALAQYGVPSPPLRKLQNGGLPSGLGYPVALKAEHPRIVHRFVHQLVVLGIDSDEAFRSAAESMERRCRSEGLDGSRLIAQEMAQLPEPVELLVGYRDDPAFGDVLIVGPGGTSIGRDAAGEAPPHIQVTNDFVQGAKAAVVVAAQKRWLPTQLTLEAMGRIEKALIGIWQVATDLGLREWEVNPLLVSPDGDCAVVDGIGIRRSAPRTQ